MAGKKKYVDQTRADMKSLNVYKPEYEPTIDLLGQICADRDKALKQFKDEGSQYTVEKPTREGVVMVKNPLFVLIQDLNSSIVQTRRELGLTPKGLKALKAKEADTKPTSALISLLAGEDDDGSIASKAIS